MSTGENRFFHHPAPVLASSSARPTVKKVKIVLASGSPNEALGESRGEYLPSAGSERATVHMESLHTRWKVR